MTIKSFKLVGCVIVCLSLTALFYACNNAPKTTQNTENEAIISDITHSNTIIYEGVIPCADCEGIQMTLKLSEPSQYYELTSLYIGKDASPFVEKGTFSVEHGYNNDSTATVYVLSGENPEIGGCSFLQYVATPETIIMLAQDSTINPPDKYSLTKQPL